MVRSVKKKTKSKTQQQSQEELEAMLSQDFDNEISDEQETAKDKKEKLGRVKPIVIPPLKIAEVDITIVGLTPLMVNNFDSKSQQELDDFYQQKLTAAERKKAREDKTRDRKTPEEEFQSSLYPIPGHRGKYGIPAAGIKKCAVTAASLSNVPMTVAMKAFHVVNDIQGLIEVKGSKLEMDTRMVRVGAYGNKKPATRRRGRWDSWECTFRVRYRQDLITDKQLAALYDSAGFSVGLCEYRPEKSGNLGMFEVKRVTGTKPMKG